MAGINDYSNTPSLNTTINTIDVDEGCNPANINDAIRQLMADIASLNLRNPQWVDSSHTAINCEVEFKKFEGTYIPFTASPTDEEAHGRDIHQRLVNGEWGSIATEPTE